MEIDIFNKLYGNKRSQYPYNNSNTFSKEPFIFDYIDKSRPSLTGLEFYKPPEPLTRSPVYSSFKPSSNQSINRARIPDENKFTSQSLNDFFDDEKYRFNSPDTKSLPIFSSNLNKSRVLTPMSYSYKTHTTPPSISDKTDYPMKLPEIKDDELFERTLLAPEKSETFKCPPLEKSIVEESKDDEKNPSFSKMIENEKKNPQINNSDKNQTDKMVKCSSEVKNNNDEKNETDKKEGKKMKKSKSDGNKEKNETKKEEKKDQKFMSRNVIVIAPCICVFVLVACGMCVAIPLVITLNNPKIETLNSSIVQTILVTIDSTTTTSKTDSTQAITTTIPVLTTEENSTTTTYLIAGKSKY